MSDTSKESENNAMYANTKRAVLSNKNILFPIKSVINKDITIKDAMYINGFEGHIILLYIISDIYDFPSSFFNKYFSSPIKKKPTCFLYLLEHSTTFFAM
ncbi:unknown [Clostridium sp. CAG:921]|nr:unknown [Clostridium sp. CAG:921]